MKRALLTRLSAWTLALWLAGCGSPPPVISYDYQGAAPTETTTLEGLREVAKALDYQIALPEEGSGKIVFGDGGQVELFGLPVVRGTETRPKQEELEAHDGKKYYHEFHHDSAGRLIAVAENVNGVATVDTKVIYCKEGPLAVISYNEKGPWKVQVLGRKDGKPSHSATFRAEMGANGISLSKPHLKELDPASVGAYEEKQLPERPQTWTRATVLAHYEKFHKLPDKSGPKDPWIPADILLDLAEKPPNDPGLAQQVSRSLPHNEAIRADQKLSARLLALLKQQALASEPEVALQAIEAYEGFIDSDADSKFKTTLRQMALKAEPALRLAALETLISQKGGLENPDLLDLVLKGLESDSEYVASHSADIFDRLWRGYIRDGQVHPHPKSVAAARQGLSSPYPVVRGFCVRKLVELTPATERGALLPEVSPLLTDSNEFVKTGAALAVGEIGREESVPALVALMEKDQSGYCIHQVENAPDKFRDRFEQVDSKSSMECYVTAFEKCAPGYEKPASSDVYQRKVAALAWWNEEDE